MSAWRWWGVCVLAGAVQASAQTPPVLSGLPPLDVAACERLLAQVYGNRLPLQVDAQTVRRAVRCRPGQTRPVLIEHDDHVLEVLTPNELARIRPAVQRTGRDNALVRQRCAEAAFRDWLDWADMAFRLYVGPDLLGTVHIRSELCVAPVPAPPLALPPHLNPNPDTPADQATDSATQSR